MHFVLSKNKFLDSSQHSLRITFPALSTLYFGTSSQKSLTYWSTGFATISSGVPTWDISPSFMIAI